MRVIAAIDGSSHSQHIIEAVAQRVWDTGTVIKLVTIIEEHEEHVHSRGGYHRIEYKPVAESPSRPHHDLAQSAEYLKQRLGQRSTEVLIDPEIIVGQVIDTILTLSKHWQADLIVMGTHGRIELEKILAGNVNKRDLRRLMLGSAATTISNHAPCSVLIVR
jgi:nucleotide-binding universal stress UspA family protein